MRVLAVINPVAGRGRALRLWPRLRPHFVRAGWSVSEALSQGPGHAIELVAQGRDYDGFLAVGGDGTSHEVANGILRAQGAGPQFLAPVPVGTANDFAAGMGLPLDPEEAVRALLTGRTRRIDVGRVKDRFFLAIAGCGFDAEVARQVNVWPKLFGGKVTYVAGIFHKLATFRPVPAEVTVDGRVWVHPLFMLAAGNLPAYAGGLRMCPDARPTDGLLEVVLVRDVARWEVVRLLPRLLDGTHVRHPKVAVVQAREVSVRAQVSLAVHADGEFLGFTPARFTCHPQALDVLVPVPAAEAYPLPGRAAHPVTGVPGLTVRGSGTRP